MPPSFDWSRFPFLSTTLKGGLGDQFTSFHRTCCWAELGGMGTARKIWKFHGFLWESIPPIHDFVTAEKQHQKHLEHENQGHVAGVLPSFPWPKVRWFHNIGAVPPNPPTVALPQVPVLTVTLRCLKWWLRSGTPGEA